MTYNKELKEKLKKRQIEKNLLVEDKDTQSLIRECIGISDNKQEIYSLTVATK